MSHDIKITTGRRRITVDHKYIDLYRDDLLKSPHFNATTADTHMSFLYAGNLIPVREFIQWYESYPEFPPLRIEHLVQNA